LPFVQVESDGSVVTGLSFHNLGHPTHHGLVTLPQLIKFVLFLLRRFGLVEFVSVALLGAAQDRLDVDYSGDETTVSLVNFDQSLIV